MIIGICGFIGSGKGTVGDHLVREHGFVSLSFARALKDATAAIFNWPRDLLEGDTKESREWRETVDPWWSKKMDREVTPRWALQHIGTEVMRNNFSDNIWIWNVERQIRDLGNRDIVITDLRFDNEISMLRNLKGGKTLWIRKSELPEWYHLAHAANSVDFLHAPECYDEMIKLGVHRSEWAWIGQPMDHVIINDGSIGDLYNTVDDLLVKLRAGD